MTDDFLSDYQHFDQRRRLQRDSGTNDFSLLACVLSVNSEVRLHSRFLYALLDPQGKHNKGSLFARHFLGVLGFPDWLDWSRVVARRETDNIDLYLTDGKRHVIIENKLNAADQQAQIERYVDQVASASEADAGDILVVYLSKGRSAPSAYSLGALRITDSSADGVFLVDLHGVGRARYCPCHYGTDILRWIELCEQEVQDAPNLVHALRDYRHVVALATNTYKSKLMNLESFLADGDSAERIRMACKISAEMPEIKAGWLEKFFLLDLPAALPEASLLPLQMPALDGLHFEARHARAFFGVDSGRDNRNKGRFWRVTAGPYRDRLALAVFFGRRMLHIGVVPLAADAPALELDAGFQKHTAVQAVLPGLVSWAQPLDEVIGQLARFDDSEQAAQLERLLAALLPG